jgi:hypothetical protein
LCIPQLGNSIPGLRFSPDGAHLLIADKRNNRLSLFGIDGVFVRVVGEDVVQGVEDVAFASNGDILALDCWSRRVCKFSGDGSVLLGTFGGPASRTEVPAVQFNAPTAMATTADHLFVIDEWSADVQVFS